MSEVFLNGKYVGDVEDGEAFSHHMRSERRVLSSYCSGFLESNNIELAG